MGAILSRHQCTLVCYLWLSNIVFSTISSIQGFMLCLVGPSLLDLQITANTTTKSIAMVFIGRAIGGLTGSLLFALVLARWNQWRVMAAAFVTMATSMASMPWLGNVIAVTVVYGIAGAGFNVADTGRYSFRVQSRTHLGASNPVDIWVHRLTTKKTPNVHMGFHQWPLVYPHKGPVGWRASPCHDVIKYCVSLQIYLEWYTVHDDVMTWYISGHLSLKNLTCWHWLASEGDERGVVCKIKLIFLRMDLDPSWPSF